MIFNETYTLSNGVKIPKLGLGTWFIDDTSASEAVRQVVSIGYRHIDTAQAYQNEVGVGKGIQSSGVPRGDIFVTSKVAAEAKSYATAAKSITTSLEKMGLDYIDMMLIHSPQPWAEWRGEKRYDDENRDVWRALEDAYKAGNLKAIGVSNFLVDDLENVLAGCEIKPMVNQILTHVGNTPMELIRFCQENGMLVEAYSPIAHGEALRNEQIAAMADKYSVSVAQLCIKYVLALGAVALPKTANPAHMKDNAMLDFTLSEEDMERLKAFTPIKDYGESSRFPVFSGR
jgi:diketogulonate reductase-like aldo/keto reductase